MFRRSLFLILAASMTLATACTVEEDDPEVDCAATPEDPACTVDCDATPDDPACQPPPAKYRFVLIEDQTDPVDGEYPGTDLDAIGLLKAETETFATVVEGADVPVEGNSAADTNGVLGAPDFDCADGAAIDPTTFTALGGKAAGGYVIVSFGTDAEDITLENGDSLKIYEVGKACNARYEDDEYSVTLSTGNEIDSFTEQGTLGEGSGNATIEITGLE